MALFVNDFEAIIYFLLILGIIYLANKTITLLLNRTKKITIKQKSIINFGVKITSILIIVYLIIEGFPAFQLIDPAYRAILTGSISTAIAFASSEIFSNFVTGIVLMSIGPFDVGDIVKIKGQKGIIRSISLIKVVIETFDNVMIEKSNSEIFSSEIINYTIRLKKVKNLKQFKSKAFSPQEKGLSDLKKRDINREIVSGDEDIKAFFETYSKKINPVLHVFTFRMDFPFQKYRIRLDKIEKLCEEFSPLFGFKPRFYIVNFALNITIQFRILTTDTNKIFDHQADFTEELYKIGFSSEV